MENNVSTLQDMVVMTALNKMFKQGHFSICTIDEVAKVLKVYPSGEEYSLLRVLHCVDYKDMPRELYNALPGMICKCLSLTQIYEFEHLKEKKVVVKVSPMRRFLGLVEG